MPPLADSLPAEKIASFASLANLKEPERQIPMQLWVGHKVSAKGILLGLRKARVPILRVWRGLLVPAYANPGHKFGDPAPLIGNPFPWSCNSPTRYHLTEWSDKELPYKDEHLLQSSDPDLKHITELSKAGSGLAPIVRLKSCPNIHLHI